jgi:hypothetical protein
LFIGACRRSIDCEWHHRSPGCSDSIGVIRLVVDRDPRIGDVRLELLYLMIVDEERVNLAPRGGNWGCAPEERFLISVTNGSFVDGNAMDGLLKSLTEGLSVIYCFDLRGNQRTSGETSRREGGKIFGSGSRAPIAITLLVKNSNRLGPCQVNYYDIGDYLT